MLVSEVQRQSECGERSCYTYVVEEMCVSNFRHRHDSGPFAEDDRVYIFGVWTGLRMSGANPVQEVEPRPGGEARRFSRRRFGEQRNRVRPERTRQRETRTGRKEFGGMRRMRRIYERGFV